MATSSRAWWSVAARARARVAPAGHNFVVPSTTCWIYELGAKAPRGFKLEASGQHIPFDEETPRCRVF
ncbi:hypothetical protein [Enhygromyxa salina]|uniref:Uncharacterized protein n=1 Tax=Enhygromyxa salina TaxID=215803 RepID=A0A2S9YM07_9BACT|nr:hypothetical protein [Enhygromyxa salina]PRQ06137.1 hypothetical protein ENSA7_41710 [Enhygromyxa salina]